MPLHHSPPRIPVVMVFGGHDPTGGAGIQADMEALISMGCHAATIITTLTVQDTQHVHHVVPVPADQVVEQARAVLNDMPIATFKIGLVGSTQNAAAIHTLLRDYPDIPVVLDPIVKSGAGDALSNDAVLTSMQTMLFPLTTVLTPNSYEARVLAPAADTLDACAHALMDQGCEYVLITGTHETTPCVTNHLYGNARLLETYEWKRLPHSYHGSGCTLASAIAGLLAQDATPQVAVRDAQQYTWDALNHGYRLGMGQHLPNRLFWGFDENVFRSNDNE